MNEYDKLHAQVHDCGECLQSFLLKAVDAQPDLAEHAGIIRDHLGALRRELDQLARLLKARERQATEELL